jgi:hypothetical protein
MDTCKEWLRDACTIALIIVFVFAGICAVFVALAAVVKHYDLDQPRRVEIKYVRPSPSPFDAIR